jgi:hypothetical protein
MKIDGVKNKAISGKSAQKKASSGQDISFGSLLAGQLNPVQESLPVAAPEGIPENSPVSSSTRLAGLTLSENTIDILAAFSEALANLSISSENLQPLIEELEGETMALLDIKEQLEENDPLAELLDRIAAVAYLETEKYRRGDYDRR